MDDNSRDRILMEFISCTNIEDIEECGRILEKYNWKLKDAVQAVHSQSSEDSKPMNPSTTTKKSLPKTIHRSIITQNVPTAKKHFDSDDNESGDDVQILKSEPSRSKTVKSTNAATSGGTGHDLIFNVQYKDRHERVTISNQQTVRQLQVKIEEKFKVSPQRQNFTNWTTKRYDDLTTLRELNLPKENTIVLTATPSTVSKASTGASASTSSHTTRTTGATSSSTRTASTEFPLTVRFEEKTGKFLTFSLALPPKTTIEELKKQVETLSHVPVRQQLWSGLQSIRDSDEIGRTHLRPKSTLTFRRQDAAAPTQGNVLRTHDNRHTTVIKPARHEPMDIDEDVRPEHLYDENDDVQELPHQISPVAPTSGATRSNRELLIPDHCTDDTVALENFSRVFHLRYNSTGPFLYIGSLQKAIQDSLKTTIIERRPLAIYLHQDRSICANVFCTQVLAVDTVIDYLANNYIVWAWDFTCDSNRSRFFDIFKRNVTPQNAQSIAHADKDSFPLLLTLGRFRGPVEIVDVIEGKSTIDEVISSLMRTAKIFNQHRQRDMEEEMQRETRENLKRQQEEEYNRSLQADIAKAKAQLENEAKEKEEQERKEVSNRKRLKEQKDCRDRLPAEPSESETNLTKLKIRLPDDGGILMRRFRTTDTLQNLFDYLTSEGHMFGEYKLLTAFPKRDLTTNNGTDTFQKLKLSPQEQLILESL